MNSDDKNNLSQSLRSDAQRIFQLRAPNLADRVRAALREEPARARRSHSRPEASGMDWTWLTRPWLPALLATGILCVALFGWGRGQRSSAPQEKTAQTTELAAAAAPDAESALRSADAFTAQLRGLMELEQRMLVTAATLAPEEELLRGEARKVYDDASRVASSLWEGLPSDWVRTLKAN